MGEIVRAALAEPSPVVAEPVANRFEQLSFLFLKGNEPVGSEDDAYLLRGEADAVVLVEPFENDVEVIAVVLHLWALFGVQDVFDNQRVEAEDGSHLPEKLDVLEAVDMNPGDGLAVRGRHQPLQRPDLLFREVRFIVFAQRDFRPVRMHLTDVNQGAGRQAGLRGSSFCGSGHLRRSPSSVAECRSSIPEKQSKKRDAGGQRIGFLLTNVSELRT